MDRAIILIGVSRVSGGFQTLRGVEAAIDGMQAWANSQGIPPDRIIRRTDRDCPVTVRQIFDDVRGLPPTVEQVIIYFSGHGIVNARQEFWLLSEAPEVANEAVNLEGTIALARSGGITHVVFISDACRTAAPGIQLGRVTGSDIFPNITNADLERTVDVFFATSLGAPALELRHEGPAGDDYNAVYSRVLIRVLKGEVPEAISVDGFIRPRKLKHVLPNLVRDELRKEGFSLLTNQTPDARVTSDDDAWISKVNPALAAADAALKAPSSPRRHRLDRAFGSGTSTGSGARSAAWVPPESMPSGSSLEQTVIDAMHALLRDKPNLSWFYEVHLAADKHGKELLEKVWESEMTERPSGKRTPGIQVMGRHVARLTPSRGYVRLHQKDPGIHVLAHEDSVPFDCLLEFEDGTGTLMPAIPGYRCTLQFEGTHLNDVMFEPADAIALPIDMNERLLRRVMAEATRRGVMSLDRNCAQALSMHLSSAGVRDPSMDLYAAYAFHERGDSTPIREMAQQIRDHLSFNLFDLALLSRDLIRESRRVMQPLTFTPLLAQGWAFVEALGGPWVSELRDLKAHLIDSPWSVYDRLGVAHLKEIILSGRH